MSVSCSEGYISPLKGRKQTPEHIAKRVAAWHKSPAPEKQKERLRELNASRVGVPLSEETKLKQSIANKGKQNCLGHKQSEERRRRQSEYWLANREKLNHYIDGKGAERNGLRQADCHSFEYRLWRKAVLDRDNRTCVHCGERSGKLHVDHIKPYSLYPELRYDIANGRTLCPPCHRKTPTYGRRVRRASVI